MPNTRVERIRDCLIQALNPTQLDVRDDSQQHVGHAGAASGGGHFTVSIASAAFADKSLIACHQLVYGALGDMMQTDIHALSIQIIK